MSRITVKVKFEGVVECEVGTKVPLGRRRALARRVALAKVLAVTDNPDAPEEAACDEYAEQHKLTEAIASRDWDNINIIGVSGEWTGD